ncbi:cytochrome c oxidase subunit 5c [Phtheirospermum japonicum]|uniref:Cytochrome c oxidase subunit 5c n=1 Tax=Phtheirospermum japonicum TaxID=374723 RepID=A0A830CS56_9LAMI|nr:cytochrome c oxidase subunit 5c [Phtheirospermum japonicum]
MEASSSSVSLSRYHSVSELNPTTRRYIGRNPGCAVPNFVKLRQDPLKCKYLPPRLCVTSENGGGFRKSLRGVDEGDGVIIVDHGSRRKESNLMLNEFVVMFKEKTKYPIVEPAHMELAEPSIKDAFDSCVRQGAQRVIVSPFFLFPGRHWHQDIPSLTAEAAKEHPGDHISRYCPSWITYCLSHVAGEEDECSPAPKSGKASILHFRVCTFTGLRLSRKTMAGAHVVYKGPSILKEILIGIGLGLAAGALWKRHHWNNQRRTKEFYDLLDKGEISVVREEDE